MKQPRFNFEEVRRRRLAIGATMQEMVDRSGLPGVAKWNNLEKGALPDPRISTVAAIAVALECSIDDLVTYPKKDTKR